MKSSRLKRSTDKEQEPYNALEMEHTNRPKPENVLHLSELDVNLVQALSKHWIVAVEQQGNEVLLELYPYVDERNFNDHTNDSNDFRRLGND